MSAPQTPWIGPPLSKARTAGPLLFISGQLARGADGTIVPGGIEAQAAQAIANLRAVLGQHGAGLGDVVKANVWLTDSADLERFNRVYREHFDEPLPARTLVVSTLPVDGAKVEIEAVAYLAP